MQRILDEITHRLAAGQRLALCTVVESRGSTPQGAGAKMLVTAEGQIIGTLGGGCVEAEVRLRAMELLAGGESKLLEFRLDHDYGWDDGLICGGVMGIYVQVLNERWREHFERLSAAMRAGEQAEFVVEYASEQGRRRYAEVLGPPPTLLIAGAGHVGQALASLAATLDFRVAVIDDRADFTSAERFPNASQRIVGEIEQELRRYPIDASTYVVIVTRGHRHDGRALQAVIESPARYLGLIGSKAKIKLIFDDLMASGVDRAALLRVHAPIGLDIGAVSVAEIAVSIGAELIAIRRGREGMSAAMKMPEDELRRWLGRER